MLPGSRVLPRESSLRPASPTRGLPPAGPAHAPAVNSPSALASSAFAMPKRIVVTTCSTSVSLYTDPAPTRRIQLTQQASSDCSGLSIGDVPDAGVLSRFGQPDTCKKVSAPPPRTPLEAPLPGSCSNKFSAEVWWPSCLSSNADTSGATPDVTWAGAIAKAPHGPRQNQALQGPELNRGPLLMHVPVAVQRAESEAR